VLLGGRSHKLQAAPELVAAWYRAAGGKPTYTAVAADVGVIGQTLRSWVRQAEQLAGRGIRDESAAEGCGRRMASCAGRRRSGNSSGIFCAGRPSIRAVDEGVTRRWGFIFDHRADF
jgi:hypothetical protein